MSHREKSRPAAAALISLPSAAPAPVALRAGRVPEAGHSEAGGSRLCVCSRAHVSRENGGGRVCHRSLSETHDQVCSVCH